MRIMKKSKEIFKIRFLVHPGKNRLPEESWECKPIETHSQDWKGSVRKFLNKNRHAMDLDDDNTFKILSVHSAGFGTL